MKKNILYIIFAVVIFICFTISLICFPFLLIGSISALTGDFYFSDLLTKDLIALLIFGFLLIPAVILFIKGIHGSAKQIVDTSHPLKDQEYMTPEELEKHKRKNTRSTIFLTLIILAAIAIRIILFLI